MPPQYLCDCLVCRASCVTAGPVSLTNSIHIPQAVGHHLGRIVFSTPFHLQCASLDNKLYSQLDA
jgi:hypothetical protein